MKVLEFAFVGYPVTDLKRARAFYEGVLGLKSATVWAENEKEGWVEYEIGPHTLAITNGDPNEWKPSEQGSAVALEVEDFDEAVRELKEKRVAFYKEPMDFPMCRMALIQDPDGNVLAIHKRKG
jgi:predicted enzyme related to lactoylglutathione lyase